MGSLYFNFIEELGDKEVFVFDVDDQELEDTSKISQEHSQYKDNQEGSLFPENVISIELLDTIRSNESSGV
jgi:hypothetical protein